VTEGELEKIIRLRNRYDTELALTTNLRLFTDDWQQMKNKLDEAKKDIMELIGFDELLGDVFLCEDEREVIQRIKKLLGDSS